MRFYKLIDGSIYNQKVLKVGDIYPETHRFFTDSLTVGDFVRKRPQSWEEVLDPYNVEIPKIKFLNDEIL